MTFTFKRIDHIQLAAPKGSEQEARNFFSGMLGLKELEKPADLKKKGGVWFQLGSCQLHIGIEEPFSPAEKAHPALEVENLKVVKQHLSDHQVNFQVDNNLPGANRIYLDDPFGNRMELLEWTIDESSHDSERLKEKKENTPNDLVIRPAVQEDVPLLYSLMNAYITDFYQQKEPEEKELKELIRHLLSNPAAGLQFVAEANGKLVGFATLYFTFSTLQVKKQAILNDLFVIPEVRGRKIGEQLFQTCLNKIRENDYCSMIWETGKDNLVAQSLYKKMGGEQSDWLYYEIQ